MTEASWQDVALFRSELYRFLGHCLLEPIQADRASLLRPAFWQKFPLAPANEVMSVALDKLDGITAALAKTPKDAALQKLQAEYMVLFLGPGEPLAPPWESMYRTPERLLFGPPAFQVREAMARFGVEAAAKYRQPEDHMGLEIMLLSAASEAAAAIPGTDWKESARWQGEFIKGHPLAWIDDWERDASAHGPTGFYGALIGLVRGVLLWDCELLAEYAGGQAQRT